MASALLTKKYMDNTFGRDIIPFDEQERLQALERIKLLNEIPQGYFDTLAQIIAQTFNVPIALVSLVGKETVEFPGNSGMGGTTEVPRGVSLCSLAIFR